MSTPLANAALGLIHTAMSNGETVDDDNVIYFLADNFPKTRFETLKEALILAGLDNCFPRTCGREW